MFSQFRSQVTSYYIISHEFFGPSKDTNTLLPFTETKKKKKTLATKEKSSQEDTIFTKVYEASKRRRKILLEEPEEEEAEDVNTSQFVKGKLLWL